jgi:hypothetical protein
MSFKVLDSELRNLHQICIRYAVGKTQYELNGYLSVFKFRLLSLVDSRGVYRMYLVSTLQLSIHG